MVHQDKYVPKTLKNTPHIPLTYRKVANTVSPGGFKCITFHCINTITKKGCVNKSETQQSFGITKKLKVEYLLTSNKKKSKLLGKKYQ